MMLYGCIVSTAACFPAPLPVAGHFPPLVEQCVDAALAWSANMLGESGDQSERSSLLVARLTRWQVVKIVSAEYQVLGG